MTLPRSTRATPDDDDVAGGAARTSSGGPADFERIVAEHQTRIARLVGRLVDRRDDVGDVVQEVFLAVLQNLDSFRGESQLATWLTTIAVNKCRSHRRRRALRPKSLWQLARTLAAPRESQPVEAAETSREVRRAVDRLAPRYREPIVLRYFEQLPTPEIGQILGLSTNAVEVRLSRARSRLREILSNRWDEP